LVKGRKGGDGYLMRAERLKKLLQKEPLAIISRGADFWAVGRYDDLFRMG